MFSIYFDTPGDSLVMSGVDSNGVKIEMAAPRGANGLEDILREIEDIILTQVNTLETDGVNVERCGFCNLPGGFGNHEH